jgi:hypothetical protein
MLLLHKFPHKAVVLEAANGISTLFCRTASADVAIAAVECFRNLSPLQFMLFDGVKHIKKMLDVEKQLSRFSPEKQSQLFEAFQSVSQILDDADIIKASRVGASASKTRLRDAAADSNPELTHRPSSAHALDAR